MARATKPCECLPDAAAGGSMNALSTFTAAALVIRLAEMAGSLRAARLAGAQVPLLCLLDCSARNWIAWGCGEVCLSCGTPPLPADRWHALLTAALRATCNERRYAA